MRVRLNQYVYVTWRLHSAILAAHCKYEVPLVDRQLLSHKGVVTMIVEYWVNAGWTWGSLTGGVGSETDGLGAKYTTAVRKTRQTRQHM